VSRLLNLLVSSIFGASGRQRRRGELGRERLCRNVDGDNGSRALFLEPEVRYRLSREGMGVVVYACRRNEMNFGGGIRTEAASWPLGNDELQKGSGGSYYHGKISDCILKLLLKS